MAVQPVVARTRSHCHKSVGSPVELHRCIIVCTIDRCILVIGAWLSYSESRLYCTSYSRRLSGADGMAGRRVCRSGEAAGLGRAGADAARAACRAAASACRYVSVSRRAQVSRQSRACTAALRTECAPSVRPGLAAIWAIAAVNAVSAQQPCSL
jgi:hypothetical protein